MKYVVADIYGGLYTENAVTEKKALAKLKKVSAWGGNNIFMLGVDYWNAPHKYNVDNIIVKGVA